MSAPFVAIGSRLRRHPEFITLGLRTNWEDYGPAERELILRSPKVCYPTDIYAELLTTLGRPIFPSLECHLYESDKIRQTTFLQMAGLPHPRTRFYHGRQRSQISQHFSYPFIAKTPRASALGRGVYLIRGPEDLSAYLAKHNPAYIQEYLPITRDIRVVVIGYQPVVAYWRLNPVGSLHSNLARGGMVDLSPVPAAAIELAVEAARLAKLNEVGVDLFWIDGRPLLVEFNVKYGRQGPAQAGVDVVAYVARGILEGRL